MTAHSHPSSAPRRALGVAAGLVALLAALPGPVASGAPGLGCGLVGLRLEGECYDVPMGDPVYCISPDEARVVEDATASGGRLAERRHDSCGLDFGVVEFPRRLYAGSARGGSSDLPSPRYPSVSGILHLDDVPFANFHWRPTAPGEIALAGATPSGPISAGAHRVAVSFISVPFDLTYSLDFVDFQHCGWNRAPGEPAPPSASGLAGLPIGWAGYPYEFEIAPVPDSDGDPVSYYWVWGQSWEYTLRPTRVSHAFATTGETSAAAVAIDDPSWREDGECQYDPLSQPGYASSFEVIPDFASTIDRTWRHCVQDQSHPAIGTSVVAGACTITSKVATEHPELVDRVEYRLDGRTIATDRAAPWAFTYRSTEHAIGERALEACAFAKADVHARAFCSAPWRFVNVGLKP